jgi:hypothetical protein
VIETVPVGVLRPHPRNPRRGDVRLIAGSLKRNGQYRPILVQRATNIILAGYHTWQAAQLLGWTHIAVLPVEVDDDAALRLLLMDNRSSDVADYDDALLAELHALIGESAPWVVEGEPAPPVPPRPRPRDVDDDERGSGANQFDRWSEWESSPTRAMVLELTVASHRWLVSRLEGAPALAILDAVSLAVGESVPMPEKAS